MRVLSCVFVLWCGFGCKGSDAPAPAVGSAGSGSATAPATAVAAAPADAAAAAAAVTSKIETARCDDPCLFLLDTPIAQLVDTFKTKCGGKQTKDLGFEDCKQLDYVRNCVYAAHGVVYKKKKWKKVFEAKSWYEPHADVSAKKIAMSDVEHANVHELYMRGKACKKGLQISGADYEQIKKWFAALPKKPPLPKLLFDRDEAVSAKDFMARVQDELGKDKVPLKGAMAAYETLDADSLDDMDGLEAGILKKLPSPHDKVRAVQVMFDSGNTGNEENPITEGTRVHFFFGDKNAVIGLSINHYLYD